MLDLGKVSVSTFEPFLHDTFRLIAGDTKLELKLSEARQLRPASPEEARGPFVLTLRGATGQQLPQKIYRFEHEKLGAMEIFIVPIALEGTDYLYEAVFA